MKKYILPIILLILSLLLFYLVNKKVNIKNYNKMENDRDLAYMIKGTQGVLYNALEKESLNWGKGNDDNARLYLKYAKYNIDELAYYVGKRKEDAFSVKASLLINDLYELYELKELIGNDQETFKKQLDKLYKRSIKHEQELEKVIK